MESQEMQQGSEHMADDEDLDDLLDNIQFAVVSSSSWILSAMNTCLFNWKEVRNDRPFTGREYIIDILQGHHKRCHARFRMYTDTFLKLCEEVMQQGIIRERDVTVEEQVGMFLQIVAHSDPMDKVAEDFQYSTETVWRCFHIILRSILRIQGKYIKLPSNNAPIHPKISEELEFSPFKNALGAIDGTHIAAFADPNEENKERFRNRKQAMSQNVMAVVDFDGNFLAVTAGCEGSAHDNLVLRKALDAGFVVPPNRYYLVDGGYANTGQFLSPFRGRPYHLDSFDKYLRINGWYQCPEDMFNHRHAQLRNIVEKTFGILKNRFKICQWMHKYKYKTQVKIVIACCTLHNFINHDNGLHQISDITEFDVAVENVISAGDNSVTAGLGSTDNSAGNELRETIMNELWNLESTD